MKDLENAFSIWSSFDVELTPEDMVLRLEKRGMHVSELSDEHAAVLLSRGGDPEEIGRAFGEFARAHGVTFPQGHLWLRVRLCDKSIDVVSILKDWFRLFSAIGIKNGVLHCDGASFPEGTSDEEKTAANVEVLKKLAPIAEKLGLTICLENLRGAFDTAEKLLAIIEKVGSPNLAICLDTGHLNLTHHGTQEAFILAAGDKLKALHLANNEENYDQHLNPYGHGTVDFEEVMCGLKKVGYDGLLNYEVPGERNMPIVLRDAMTEYLRHVTEYFYTILEG